MFSDWQALVRSLCSHRVSVPSFSASSSRPLPALTLFLFYVLVPRALARPSFPLSPFQLCRACAISGALFLLSLFFFAAACRLCRIMAASCRLCKSLAAARLRKMLAAARRLCKITAATCRLCKVFGMCIEYVNGLLFFFTQHLCYGSPFLPPRSVSILVLELQKLLYKI